MNARPAPTPRFRQHRRRSAFLAVILAALTLGCLPAASLADDAYTLTIKDHAFSPATLEIPAGQKIKVTVTNADPTPEEFESEDLHIEKIVSGNGTIAVFVGPLDPGRYGFVGEQHEDTARGTFIVR